MSGKLTTFEEYLTLLISMDDIPSLTKDIIMQMTAELVLASQDNPTNILHAQQIVGGN